MMNTAPGIQQYKSYIMNQGYEPNKHTHIFETHIIPEEESDQEQEDDNLSFQPPDPVQAIDKSGLDHKVHHTDESTAEDTQQNHNDTAAAEEFSLELPHMIPDDKEPTTISAQDELMRWHYHLNDLSFKCMFKMAKQGLLPKKILKANVHICPACQYGKMHRKPWRTKGKPSNPSRVATEPGQIMSVDQLESPTPGFIAQLKGTLTKQRYKYATVFVDQYSRLSYVHLQRTIMSDETVQAKIAFERYSKKEGCIYDTTMQTMEDLPTKVSSTIVN